jgi:inward rectifier potassium channel
MLKSIFSRATERELGFGTTATIGGRLMEANGRFRVRRTGAEIGSNFFHFLLTMSWAKFNILVFSFFFLLNLGFAFAYTIVGIEHLNGIESGTWEHNFIESFFFSTQTMTTVGYGRISPVGFYANILASAESLLGLLSFAVISGLMYGRFSRPTAKIIFSKIMVVAPFENGQGLMFRMANARRSELLDTEVNLILAINQLDAMDKTIRRFHNLELQFSKITFFTLNWTIVHKIGEKSPFFGLSKQELTDAHAEILVLVKGIDETHAQQVHARTSFIADEIEWNAKFLPIVGHDKSGRPEILLRRLGDFERIS